MDIKIGFSTESNLLSSIIRWFTHSTVSHAWMLLPAALGGLDMVMQSTGQGFQLMTYDRFLKGNRVVALVPVKQPVDAGVTQALQWLGEPYDDLGLLGMAWVALGRRFKRNWGNALHSNSSMWCSEAVVYVLQAAKYPGADKLDPSRTSPEDLLEFMQA